MGNRLYVANIPFAATSERLAQHFSQAGTVTDVQIMLDAHGSTGVTEAIKLAREVEQYDIAWYEEPVIYHNFPGMAEVRRATSIPIALDVKLLLSEKSMC